MRVLSKKTVLCFLGAILILTIALRYPLVEHERFQSDSYYIHILADSIVRDGHASWTFHPLSYVGYYPFSYSSGVPFLMAEVSELTGLRVDACILLSNMVLGVLYCLGCFLLARQFLVRPEFILLATLFAVCAPRFVDTTYWDGSARGPLIVLLTLAVLAAHRGSRMGQGRMYAIAAVFGATTFAIHHMAVLFVIFGMSYVIATFQAHYLLPKVFVKRRQAAAFVNSAFIFGLLVVTFFLFDYLTNPEETGLVESSLFNFDIPLLDILADLAVSYTSQIGFILPVAVIAMFSLFRRSQFSLSNIFLFSAIVCFIPLLDRALYVAMVLTPFAAILGTMWIRNLDMYSKRRIGVILLTSLLVVTAIILPFWMSARWNDETYISKDKVEVNSQDFNDASYLRVMYPGTYAISNNNLGSMVLFANSDTGFLDAGIMLAINGDINETEILKNVTWWNEDFPVNMYTWYQYSNTPHMDSYILRFYMNGMDGYIQPGIIGSLDRDRHLILIDRDWPSKYVNQYGIANAKLPGQLYNAEWLRQLPQPSAPVMQPIESYMVYQSSGNIVYVFAGE